MSPVNSFWKTQLEELIKCIAHVLFMFLWENSSQPRTAVNRGLYSYSSVINRFSNSISATNLIMILTIWKSSTDLFVKSCC